MCNRRVALMCILLTAAVLWGCGEKPPAATETGARAVPVREGVVSVTDFTPEAPMDPGERPTYVCRRAKGPVTVDGDLAEWTDVPAIVLDQPRQAHRAWKDASDMSGTARLCYDSHYLYLAFDVTDDVFSHTYPLIPIWAGDCVQFAFDPLEDRKRDSRAPDDQEMTVALTPEGPRLARWAGPKGRGDVEAARLGLVRKRPGGGVVYELAIPWNELAPLAPGLRNAFGFTFTFNDSDGEPNKGWLEWTPGIQDSKDPYSFGQVVLEYAAPPEGESELYVAGSVPERPDVASLRFEIFRNTPRDETVELTLALARDNSTVVETTTDLVLTPGVHMHAVSWQPASLPDGSYEGTIRVTCPDGGTLRQAFSYERLITAPLTTRLDAIRAKIAQLAQMQPELYVRYEAGLAYRVDVAALWLAGDSTVRNWRNLPKLVDETEGALDAMLAGTDLFAAERGTLLRAYRAPEDDMPQPYRVQVPADYDGSKPYPLVLNLHGYGGTGLTWDLWYSLTVRANESDRDLRPGYIVVIPYGRGNTGWQGWGRNDVFHVIEAVRRDYRIDGERISVSGFSMGGSGTWYLATRYPHFWSAAGPQAGGLGRYDFLKPEEADDWTRQLSAAGSQMLVLRNLRNLPTVIYHGIADDTVSFNHTEEAHKRLRELKYDAVLIASVRAGHGSVSPALRTGLADWLVEHRRDIAPKEVVYATCDLRHNRAYWVEIDELVRDYHPAEVTAEFTAPGRIALDAKNVSRLTLTLPDVLMGDVQSLTVVANGFEVQLDALPPERLVHLATTDGGTTWTVSQTRWREGLVKRHGMSGPIGEAFADRFILVCGTAGDDEADRANRADAEGFAERLKGLTWGRVWGDFPIRTDADVTAEDVRSANLILFGGADTNIYTRKIAAGLPAKVEDGKLVFRGKTYDDLSTAVRYVYPNPENPGRYVVVTCGAGRAAVENVDPFAWPQPDWLIFNAESAKRRAENQRPVYAEGGFFDRDWK